MIDLIFTILALITVLSSVYLVTSKNLVRSAVALFFTLFGLAGFYIMLYADFVAGAQILIYVGGILVLIIFGVMLTNKMDKPSIANSSQNQVVAAFVCLILFIAQLFVILKTDWKTNLPLNSDGLIDKEGTVRTIGEQLMSNYVLPFEIVSILLLAALIGAATLARKKNA
tara:strand:+ start:10 stop:519 length:510 start_codon:yes stop_codon:yes gene_type:complete